MTELDKELNAGHGKALSTTSCSFLPLGGVLTALIAESHKEELKGNINCCCHAWMIFRHFYLVWLTLCHAHTSRVVHAKVVWRDISRKLDWTYVGMAVRVAAGPTFLHGVSATRSILANILCLHCLYICIDSISVADPFCPVVLLIFRGNVLQQLHIALTGVTCERAAAGLHKHPPAYAWH